MFRVAIIKTNGEAIGENFETKDEVDNFILDLYEKNEIKKYRIMDKETGQVIETEQGKK